MTVETPSRAGASLADLREHVAGDATLTTLARRIAEDAADQKHDPSHDQEHSLRVALWTIRCGEGALLDRQAIAAAMLHDVINVPKDSPLRSSASQLSAEHSRALLLELGWSALDADEIANAVRDHSFSRGAVPESLLGRALQDADRLEALGVIGFMRCIATGVAMGAGFFCAHDPFAEDRPLDDRSYSIDHFFTKLLGLPATMRTVMGRTEAIRRAEVLRATLSALAHELEVNPPSGTAHSHWKA